MNPYLKALLLSAAAITVALLAVFDIVPETVAQFAPLAVLPFVLTGRGSCARLQKGRGA